MIAAGSFALVSTDAGTAYAPHVNLADYLVNVWCASRTLPLQKRSQQQRVSARPKSCSENDTIATYGNDVAKYRENECAIDEKHELGNLYGVMLTLTCAKEDDSGTYSKEVLLLQVDDGKVASYPPLKVLRRCGP